MGRLFPTVSSFECTKETRIMWTWTNPQASSVAHVKVMPKNPETACVTNTLIKVSSKALFPGFPNRERMSLLSDHILVVVDADPEIQPPFSPEDGHLN